MAVLFAAPFLEYARNLGNTSHRRPAFTSLGAKIAPKVNRTAFVNFAVNPYHTVPGNGSQPDILANLGKCRRTTGVGMKEFLVSRLSRLFRLLEKKRGDRRTGSNLVGSLGEALFCGTLFLLGVTGVSAIVAANFVTPESGWQIGLGYWLLVLVMASFIVIGGVGLIWTVLRLGVSAERRVALTQRATNLDLVHEALPPSREYPTLPVHDGLTNSPGIELAYRLPSSHPPGWRLLANTVFALLWNGAACVLLVIAINQWMHGNTKWFLFAFLAPFLVVSGLTIHYLVRQLWLHAGMGPTALEICDHPLLPGREYQVVLSQAGHLDVKSLELWLICEEEAAYHQGTDIRHESREVFRQRLFRRENFVIDPSGPFQQTCALPIPPHAMHSFQSEHNSVHWRLVVRGELQHWPEFERGFPIVVYPGEATRRVEVSSKQAREGQRTNQSVTTSAGAVA